jgi:hypothetical protein
VIRGLLRRRRHDRLTFLERRQRMRGGVQVMYGGWTDTQAPAPVSISAAEQFG